MSDESDDAEDEEELDEGEEDGESPPKSGFGLKKILLFVILPLPPLTKSKSCQSGPPSCSLKPASPVALGPMRGPSNIIE